MKLTLTRFLTRLAFIGITGFGCISAHAAAGNSFKLLAPDLKNGQPLSHEYFSNQFGCSGENLRPYLTWNNAPAHTKSYAITFYDRDAPTGSGFWQWVVIDIPKDVTTLNPSGLPVAAKQQLNDAGMRTWLGPCPPQGTTHHYEIKIYALDVEHLPTDINSSAALTGYFLHLHRLASAHIVISVSR